MALRYSCLILIPASMLISFAASAEPGAADTYMIPGACASQGSWTQRALAQTANIKQVLRNLKDNPACTGVRDLVETSLTAMQEKVNELQKGAPADVAASLSQDIANLRPVAKENAYLAHMSQRLMFNKTLDLQAVKTMQLKSDEQSKASAEAERDLRRKAHDSAFAGLSYFNLTVGGLARAKGECLDDAQSGLVMGGLVQTLAAFAGAGQEGLATEMSKSIANLMDLARQAKYLKAIRSLNDRQFISSMSCLLETTSENYCSTVDGQYLLEEVLSNTNIKKQVVENKDTGQKETMIMGESENFRKAQEKGPLAGYFILSRQMEVVNEWIRKLQYGVTPQLPNEASFKSDIITSVTEVMKTILAIQGTFNQQKDFLKSPKLDLSAKQSLLRDMVTNIYNSMAGKVNGISTGSPTGLNFFQQAAGGPNQLFFKLMSMDVPPAVLGQGKASEAMFAGNPSAWLDSQFNILFDKPEAFSHIVEKNMDDIFEKSRQLAEAYYAQYFIVDKVQLINDSLLGMDTNVRNAFAQIDIYLADLAQRISKSTGDPTFLSSINQTRLHISHVLARYVELRQLGLQAREGKLSEKELDKKLRVIGEQLITEVYKQFEVMTARASWLSNRMVGFVMYDYTMSVRDQNQFTPYMKDLLLTSGYNALHEMFDMSTVSYSRAKTDLAIAMNVNEANINALSGVVEDIFVRYIVKLGRQAKGMELGYDELSTWAAYDSYQAHVTKAPGDSANRLQRYLRAFGANFKMLILRNDSLAKRYDYPDFELSGIGELLTGKTIRTSISNNFDSAEIEKSLLCTQILAFRNLSPYWYFCKDSALMSPMIKKDMQDEELKKIASEYLSVPIRFKVKEGIPDGSFDKANLEQRRDNMTKRICALRDYHRRNEVARISAAMQLDGSTYDSPFLKVAQEMIEASAKQAAEDAAKLAANPDRVATPEASKVQPGEPIEQPAAPVPAKPSLPRKKK